MTSYIVYQIFITYSRVFRQLFFYPRDNFITKSNNWDAEKALTPFRHSPHFALYFMTLENVERVFYDFENWKFRSLILYKI